MEKKELKIFDENLLINRDFHLTHLTHLNNTNNYSVYILLTDYLSGYGVYACGETMICGLDKSHTKHKVISCTLDKDIPVENIGIILQMYGYKNALVNICLDRNEEREFSFWFNTNDESCELEKLFYSNVLWNRKYSSFKYMMEDIRTYDSIDELVDGKKLVEKFYITFGQEHVHQHNDIVLDKNCIGVIKAESHEKMREIAFKMFDGNFATTYTEYEIHDKLKYFSRGLIELN